MIKIQTKLKVADNSGAKKAQCIKIYKKKNGKIGDILLVSIKQLQSKSNTTIEKGNLFKALIIRCKYNNKNLLNNYFSFNENSIILLNNQEGIKGSRILGPIPIKLRKLKKLKLITSSSIII